MQNTTFRLENALITAVALVCTYTLAFYWQLDKPFWAGFTVFVVSLPTIGQTLQKGLLRTLGTFSGALIGLAFFIFLPLERFLILFLLSLYLSLTVYLIYQDSKNSYFHLISATVTMIVVLMSSKEPSNAFYLAVYRTEETILGIAVYTAITLIFAPHSSVDRFFSKVEQLLRGHEALFMLGITEHTQGSNKAIYKQYRELKDIGADIDLMLPAVKIERYSVYHNRDIWGAFIACSNELASVQREWGGILTLLERLGKESLFPSFKSKIKMLASCFALLVGKTERVPSGKPALEYDSKRFAALAPSDQSLILAAQSLYAQQMELCLYLHELIFFLLQGGERPRSMPLRPYRNVSILKPEQRSSIYQMFTIFWTIVWLWILFDPPGTENIAFLELAVLMGLSALFTGEERPLMLVVYFLYGIFFTGLLYLFVYPLITDVFVFMALMFIIAFGIALLFPNKNQASLKLGIMLPWLSIGNFTNIPEYSFLSFASSAFTLIFGISIVAVIQYCFVYRKNESIFVEKQFAFFHAVQKILLNIEKYHGHTMTLFSTLSFRYQRYRVHFLAAELVLLAQKDMSTFIDKEVAQLLGTEATDIARYLHRLSLLFRDVGQESLSNGIILENESGEKTLLEQSEKTARMTRILLNGLHASLLQVEKELPGESQAVTEKRIRAMMTLCGNILKSLSSYDEIMKATPLLQSSKGSERLA